MSGERQSIEDAHAASSGLTRRVLDYAIRFKAIVDESRRRPPVEADWAAVGELVDPARFRRTGAAREEMDWPAYVAFLTRYANEAEWHGYFRRATEAPGRVVLELEEHSAIADRTDIANTVTIFDFDAAGRIVELRVYIQS
jgi:hypothetical protein